jgi:myo-inositol-1(or 4)-monophosphatase
VSETAEVLALAVRLARAAGGVQRERYETDFRIGTKSAAIDLVTDVDHACEALIVETLRRERPRDAVLAEEGGLRDPGDAAWRWVIDPLDGTMNYAHGYPRFCVSIGVERAGVAEAGVVYDPLLDELFAATRGGGASLNGRPIHVSEETELSRALLATGFAYDVHRSQDDNVAHFARFVKRARGLRRDGSAALDLCYVAAVRFEGYWELKLHPWDVCAGGLVVREAGGRVSDFAGVESGTDTREVLASNGRVHEAMLEVLGDGR